MISADIDPSLRTGEPTPERLDDGFSPPAQHQSEAPGDSPSPPPADTTLTTKSLF